MNMSKKRFVGCIYLKDERAIKHLSDNTIIDTDPVRLAKKYSDNGVDEIEAENKEFDPNYHQAVFTEHKDGVEAGMVIEVLQKGYMYKDRVLRASMVKVSE